jgi:hypothetical protein
MKTQNVKLTCQEIFTLDLAERSAEPLLEGAHWLRAARRNLKRDLEELQVIRRYQQARGPRAREARKSIAYSLNLCQPDEISRWLADRPNSVASTLGWTVLPAIAALPDDGVPPPVAEGWRRAALPILEDILKCLDGGMLEVPLCAALHLIDQTLSEASNGNWLPQRYKRAASGAWKPVRDAEDNARCIPPEAPYYEG